MPVVANGKFLNNNAKKEPPLAEQPKEGEREVRGQTGRKTWPFAPIV